MNGLTIWLKSRHGTSRWLECQDGHEHQPIGFDEYKDKDAIEAKLKLIHDNFPDGAPYVLTHSDLNFGNIIVNNGKIEAIIDWELAGYYPWWVERWGSLERANHPGADELFDMVWAELDPGLSRVEFREKVAQPVYAVQSIYNQCSVTHTESHDIWMRPRWCECKPFGGRINRKDWDSELEHSIALESKTLDRFTLAEHLEWRKNT
jgi:hypothetical protein